MTIYLKAYDKWGRCCYNCNGVDECDCDEKVYIGDYCAKLEQAPSSLTEYRLFHRSTTCFGSWDYIVPGIWDEFTQSDGSDYYFRHKNEIEWVQNFSAPAYTMELWWNATQSQYEHIQKEDANGNPIVCGVSMVSYSRKSDGSGNANLWGLTPIVYGNNLNVVSLTRHGTSWSGGEGMFSWYHGHPSAGGWINSSGGAHFLSAWHSVSQKECPTDE